MSDAPSPAERAFHALQRNPRAYRLWADEIRRLWQAERSSHLTTDLEETP